ncbi:MAG: hypothetical protein AAFP97_05060, partial [Pseudomonadota bacterium]
YAGPPAYSAPQPVRINTNQFGLRGYTLSRPQQNPVESLDTAFPTLLILSKWQTAPLQDRQDWVRKAQGPRSTFSPNLYPANLEALTGDISVSQQSHTDPSGAYTVSSAGERWSTASDVQIESLQSITGDNLVTLYSADTFPVLVKVKDTSVYILSDPDFLNTMGLSTNIRARLGVDMLDAVIEDAEASERVVTFDLSLHGYGGNVNIIKVMTQPPFLAATLCLLAAGGLIAWQAFSRFGKPIASGQFQTQGKLSLVESASDFVGLARREPKMAPDYAKIIRQQVITWLSLQGRRPQDVDAILQAREEALTPRFRFVELEDRAERVSDLTALMKVSEDLQQWKHAMTTGHEMGQENGVTL